MERSQDPTGGQPAAEETLHEQDQLQHCTDPLTKEVIRAWAQDMLRQQAEARAEQTDESSSGR